MRGERDNQSVGLIICKSTDKTIVEWSLQDIQKPLGVASYQLQLIQGCSRICIGGVLLLVKSSLIKLKGNIDVFSGKIIYINKCFICFHT